MPMKTDSISGRELKNGSVFIPAGEKAAFFKVTEMSTAKTGKHGSAKSIVTSKNVKNGKMLLSTFLDSSERITLIHDFGYIHKIVYSKTGSEICTNLETGECIYVQSFIADDRETIEKEFAKVAKGSRDIELVDSEGSPLVIKYSEVGDAENSLVFWELLYVKPCELQRVGILDYMTEEDNSYSESGRGL